MPTVTAPPRGLQNGEVITEFTDTTSPVSVSYTYLLSQSGIMIENIGTADIFVTVGSYTNQAVKPNKTWKTDVSFTSFSIRSDVNSQAFIATAFQNDIEGSGETDLLARANINRTLQQLKILQSVGYDGTDLKRMKVISAFGSGRDGWAHESGTGVISDDALNYSYAEQSLKVTVDNGAIETISKTYPSVMDITNKLIVFKVYVTNKVNLEQLWLYFGTSALADYYMIAHPVNYLREGWNAISISVNVMSPKNGSTLPSVLQNVQTIWIRAKSKAGLSCAVTYDALGLADNRLNRGKIIFAFDDGCDGVYNLVKPIFDKKGYRGLVYTIKELVGSPGYMTLDQLKRLYDIGWDISSHGQRDLTTLDQVQLQNEFLNIYTYLIENGFPRSAMHYASHQGKYNELAIQEMKKIFSTHRTTEIDYATIPIADRYRLPNKSGNEATLAILQSYIDYVDANKVLTFINFHQIVDSGATGNQALSSTIQSMVDYVATKNVDVITLSDLRDFPAEKIV